MSCRSSIKVISAVFPEPSRVRASVFALSADSSPFNCSHSSMSAVFTFSQPINGCLSLRPYSVSALFDRRFHRLLIPMQFACERRNFLLSHANCIGINSLWNLLSNRADTEYGRRDKHPFTGLDLQIALTSSGSTTRGKWNPSSHSACFSDSPVLPQPVR